MPQRDTSGIGERVPRELIDGDFSVAFSFVEMAEEESRRDNAQLASQLLRKAEEMLGNIQERLPDLVTPVHSRRALQSGPNLRRRADEPLASPHSFVSWNRTVSLPPVG